MAKVTLEAAKKKALAEYGTRIKAKGSKAGEAIIRKYEKKFPDFRKWAYAVGIMLRSDELIREHLTICQKKMPKLLKVQLSGKATKDQKVMLLDHLTSCLWCLGVFKYELTTQRLKRLRKR